MMKHVVKIFEIIFFVFFIVIFSVGANHLFGPPESYAVSFISGMILSYFWPIKDFRGQ